MSSPYLSEIRIFSFNFAPEGWAFCDGQNLPINQNAPLFSLLGTTYGGNGTTNFNLPNLQGSTPMHYGNGFLLGGVAGEINHTLLTTEMPGHTHAPIGSSTPGNAASPGNNLWASGNSAYDTLPPTSPATAVNMYSDAIEPAGRNSPHNNMQPFLALNFCIALSGIFPTRS